VHWSNTHMKALPKVFETDGHGKLCMRFLERMHGAVSEVVCTCVSILLASSVSANTQIVRRRRPEFKRTEVSMSEETREFPWPFL
jgi:hypothetical protein